MIVRHKFGIGIFFYVYMRVLEKNININNISLSLIYVILFNVNGSKVYVKQISFIIVKKGRVNIILIKL